MAEGNASSPMSSSSTDNSNIPYLIIGTAVIGIFWVLLSSIGNSIQAERTAQSSAYKTSFESAKTQLLSVVDDLTPATRQAMKSLFEFPELRVEL